MKPVEILTKITEKCFFLKDNLEYDQLNPADNKTEVKVINKNC